MKKPFTGYGRGGSPAFSLVVLVTIAMLAAIGLMVLMMQLQPGFMGMAHGTEPHHRVHDLTFAFLLAPSAVGLLAQLRSPSKNVAGQLMALVPWLALLLAFAFATTWLRFAPAPILGALTLTATILHPARRDFVRSFSLSRVNRVMLALVIIAAVPLLVFASSNVALQRALTNDHATLGHYGFMAAFSLTVVGIGSVASFRLAGWRLTAAVAGSLPVLLGVVSLFYPANDSSLARGWAVAAIVWGIVFFGVATFTRKSISGADTRAAARPADEIGRSIPRLVTVFAVVILALATLMVIQHVAGGGPGRHAP